MKKLHAAAAFGVMSLLAGTAQAGTENTLYTFTGGADGANPRGQLIPAGDGGFYGIAEYGGLLDCVDGTVAVGCGVVFKLSPPAIKGQAWTESVLYSFTDGVDGGTPTGLVLGHDGKTLFGTTFSYSNTLGNGTIFQLSPPATVGAAWTETVLHYFRYGVPPGNNTDGVDPIAAPFVGPDGTLYGTALEGGPTLAACPGDAGGCGIVWQLKPPYGTSDYSQVYDFKGGTDGRDDPRGVALMANGKLVGANLNGGSNGEGYFYELTPPKIGTAPGTLWKETVIYNGTADFPGYGFSPPVIGPNGEILETSAAGAGPNGTAFYLVPGKTVPWSVNLIGEFNGSNGNAPDSPLLRPITVNGSSTMFGTTSSDGATTSGPYAGCGTVFGIINHGALGFETYVPYVFQCGSDGATPQGVIAGPAHSLLGVASGGGAFGVGTVFQITNIGD